MKIAYNAILCYLGWPRLLRFVGLCRGSKAKLERERKKMSSGGSEIAGRFGNFSNTYGNEQNIQELSSRTIEDIFSQKAIKIPPKKAGFIQLGLDIEGNTFGYYILDDGSYEIIQ